MFRRYCTPPWILVSGSVYSWSSGSRLSFVAMWVAIVLLFSAMTGCGLFELPNDDRPSEARIELTGNPSASARVVFSSNVMYVGDEFPLFLEADTVESELPGIHRFNIDGPEFWLVVLREDPANDEMGLKAWAGDFLFADEPALPDSQAVVNLRYRFVDMR